MQSQSFFVIGFLKYRHKTFYILINLKCSLFSFVSELLIECATQTIVLNLILLLQAANKFVILISANVFKNA